MAKINIDEFCIDDVFDKLGKIINNISMKKKKKDKDKKKKHKDKVMDSDLREVEDSGKLVIEINV